MIAAWAADCAEHVLPFREARFPDDGRPRQASAAARVGDPSSAARAVGAFDAASGAASYAAAAARAYGGAAAGAYVVAAAARAAHAAAYGADVDGARCGGGDAERGWQADRLLAYLNREIEP